MKRVKVCLAFLMIAMMVSGTAWAWNATDHVKVAPNGKGDLLIFPYYFAYPGDYSTKITVINTSSIHSVVAKVEYNSWSWSKEVKDHFLFLSPNDVWTGWLVNVNGVATLQSADDSILGKTPTYPATDEDFGNVTPVNEPLVTTGLCADDTNTMGYIYVVEVASRVESLAATGYVPGSRVAKKHIYDWYDRFVTSADIANKYPPVNVLTGYQENTFGAGATLKQANVFADYLSVTKEVLTAYTALGTGSYNSLAELEAAMAKSNVAMPYVAKSNGDYSVHIFNFPTKLSLANPSSACTGYRPYSLSPYWVLVAGSSNNRCDGFSRSIYDEFENKTEVSPFSPTGTIVPLCAEVNFNIQEYNAKFPSFTEGWIRYTSTSMGIGKTGSTQSSSISTTPIPISYTGSPVLASVLYWSNLRENPAEANAAYDDGVVFVSNVQQPYYQYANGK